MKTNDKLFRLIKSLSPLEKRYLVLYFSAQKNGKPSNYVKLFEKIYIQKEYDEPQLKKMFLGEKSQSNFSVMKKYLYDQVLSGLISLKTTNDKHKKLTRIYEEAGVLRERNLLKEALAKLEKGISLAKALDALSIWLMMIALEKKIYALIPQNDDISKRELEILGEEKLIIKKLTLRNEYETAFKTTAKLMFQYPKPLTPQEDLRMEENIIICEEQVEVDKGTFHSAILQNRTKANYYHLKHDLEKAIHYSGFVIEKWDQNPDHIKLHIRGYILDVYLYLMRCAENDKFDDYLEMVDKLKQLQPTSKIDEAYLFTKIQHMLLAYFELFENRDNVENLVFEIETGLKKHRKYLTETTYDTFAGNLAVMYHINNNLDKALEWSNYLKNKKNTNLSISFESQNLIVNLLIHYDLGNLQALPYYLQSTRNELTTKNAMSTFNLLVIKLLESVLNVPTKSDRIALFKAFLKDVEQEFKVPVKDLNPPVFVVYEWAANKGKRRTADRNERNPSYPR